MVQGHMRFNVIFNKQIDQFVIIILCGWIGVCFSAIWHQTTPRKWKSVTLNWKSVRLILRIFDQNKTEMIKMTNLDIHISKQLDITFNIVVGIASNITVMAFINTAVALKCFRNLLMIIDNESWNLTSLSGLVLAHSSSISLSGSPMGFPLSSTQFSLRNWLKSSQIFLPLSSFSWLTYFISSWSDQKVSNNLENKGSQSWSHAPSIWYDAVAHDHLKPSGNRPPGIRSRSAFAAQCLLFD